MALKQNFYPIITSEERTCLGQKISVASREDLENIFGLSGPGVEYAWVAGRSRFERLLLAGLRASEMGSVIKFFVGNLYVTISISDAQLLLRNEGLEGILEFLRKKLGLKAKEPQSGAWNNRFSLLVVPCAHEFATFCWLTFKMGNEIFDKIGYPPRAIPTPSDDHVRRVISHIEERGLRQGDFVPSRDFHPTQLSFPMQRFIVTWRRALLQSYGLAPDSKLVHLDSAEKEELLPFEWPWEEVIKVDNARYPQPIDLMRRYIES